MIAAAPSVSSFGELLRQWRKLRGVSQLDLALAAEVSARHVSFVETGRSQPSREMVLLLAGALTLPLRERNTLLVSAGFAPIYREEALATATLEPVRRAVAWTLRQQEPFPAVVMNRRWDVVARNEAARRLFTRLLAPRPPDERPNVLRLMLDPARVRPYVANWDELAPLLIQRVHREAVGGVLDASTRALLDELQPLLPAGLSRPDLTAPSLPVVPVHFRRDDLDLRCFSTVTVLGTPQDITAQELRIECFFPEDEASERQLRALAEADGAAPRVWHG